MSGPPRLFPTPTRKRRLAQVAAGAIHRYGDNCDYLDGYLKVTAAMEELRRAGWVELGEPGPVKRPWVLTELGEQVRCGS